MSSVILAALLLIVFTLVASNVYLYLRLRSLELDVEQIVDALQQYEDDSQILVTSGQQLLLS